MAYATPKAVTPNSNLGTVYGEPVSQYVINIEAAATVSMVGDAGEIIVKLNGRVVRRMTREQAERAGLIVDPGY